MNENIVNFLNGYMMNPDPQYAVFLKGKVLEGCLSCDDRESGQDPDSAVLSYLG